MITANNTSVVKKDSSKDFLTNNTLATHKYILG
jgi:hypothetical protein